MIHNFDVKKKNNLFVYFYNQFVYNTSKRADYLTGRILKYG